MSDVGLPPPRSSLPQQIGRYRIVARVGRGAMGVVYSAVDEQMDRPVALKVLMADLETDPEVRARFYREAQAAARLLHPNVITVYDAGEDQGRSFIAMQLLEGAPLPIYLKRPEAATLERKLDLMIQVCEGLAAAHAEGIIHRDLKPNNLFVQSDGVVKILDFGVARITDSSMTAAGTMLGTPDYMSPEQARGDVVDARSDIFSAGSVFYFMLAGRKPFPGPDLPALLRQLQFEDPAPLRGVPPELSTLIGQAMARNPDHRPARIEQLLADLVRFRRQYRADTRRLALSLRTQYEELEALAASLSDSSASLGTAESGAQLLDDIRAEHPFLARGASLDVWTLERQALNAAAEQLNARRDEMAALLETQYSCLRRIEEGERALAAGDAPTALAAFESVLSDYPSSGQARQLVDVSRPLARDQQLRRERVAQALALGRDALAEGNLAGAQTRAHEALALEPRSEAALALASEVAQALVREDRRVEQLLQRTLERATAAIADQRFDQAEAALAEADTIRQGAPATLDARQRLGAARAAAEAAAVISRLSGEEIRRARASFRRGRHQEALDQLAAFLSEHQGAAAVAAELDHLRRLKEVLSARTATGVSRVRELLAAAVGARNRGALEHALAAVLEAQTLDPANPQAAELLDEVLQRQLDARIAQEQRRAVDQRTAAALPILEEARSALGHGYLDIALNAALAAQRICPDAGDVSSLIEEIRAEFAADDESTFELDELPLSGSRGAPAGAPDAARPDAGMLGWLFRSGARRRK